MTTELCGWLPYIRWPWRKGFVEADADTVWKRQNEASRRNVAYQLVHIWGKGELQVVYREKGEDALREHIRWVLPKYLYYDGKKAGVISKMEFARYRYRLSKKAMSKICQECKRDTEYVNMTHCDECGHTYHIFCLNPILSKMPEDLWYCDECKKDEDHLEQTNKDLIDKLKDDANLADVKTHAACWNLKMRGVVGETPLHICYLAGYPDDIEIARIMIEEFPFLVLDIYEGTTFFGEIALHFAIIHKDKESCKLLIDQGSSLIARARGTFFLPADIQNGSSTKEKTSFQGTAYYGEYPLAFTASIGWADMYDYFIRQSELNPRQGQVHPDAQDSFGNSVLHLCVIHKQKAMYLHAVKHPILPADQNIRNKGGLTPLALACKLGHSDMFDVILDLCSEPFWTYGNITCLACPLDILDSIDTSGQRNRESALNLIIKGDTEGHFKMLESSVVARLLNEKWERYVKKRFLFKFCWAFFHLSLLLIATQLRPEQHEDLLGPTDAKSIVRYIVEIAVLIGCMAKCITEAEELKMLKPKRYFSNLLQVPARLVFIFACFLIFMCVPYRLTNRYLLEDMTLIIAIPCSWTYIFFFYRGTETLGPYVVMIGKMLKGDVLKFWVIMSTFLCYFATVFYYLFLDGNLDGNNSDFVNEGFSKPGRAFLSLFGMTYGNFDNNEFYKSRLSWFSQMLFIIFMVVSPILLLNMLIAMMAKTYDQVKERARVEWRRQWTRIILIMEGAVPKDQLLFHRSKYSVDAPVSSWSDKAKVAAAKHREKLRQDAVLHNDITNPAYDPDHFSEENYGSRENLIHRRDTNGSNKEAWPNPNFDVVDEGEPKTIKALLIMKAMEKSRSKVKKRAKYNWNVVREIVSEEGGKDMLSSQSGEPEHAPSIGTAFRAMTKVLTKRGTSTKP